MCDVSVIIPTIGREQVHDAIQSVRDQTHEISEIIVIDDSETPSPRLEQADDVILIRGEPEGLSHARNRGIEYSSGAYVAFLDDDDVWLLDKLRRQIERMEETGTAVCTCYRRTPSGDIGRCNLNGNVRKRLMTRNCVGPPSGIVVRRKVVDCHRFNPNCLIWEDREWYIRILDKFELCLVPEVLIEYDDGTGSLSASWDLIQSHGIPCLSKYSAELGIEENRIEAWACRRVGFDYLETSRLSAIYWAARACRRSVEWTTCRFLFRALIGERWYERVETLLGR